GRFIDGLSGEQFALPEAIGLLRKARQRPQDGTVLAVSAVDPLNLAGVVLAGGRGPRIPGARVAYRDGIPVAALVAGEVRPPAWLPPEAAEAARAALLRDPSPASPFLPAGIGQTTPL